MKSRRVGETSGGGNEEDERDTGLSRKIRSLYCRHSVVREVSFRHFTGEPSDSSLGVLQTQDSGSWTLTTENPVFPTPTPLLHVLYPSIGSNRSTRAILVAFHYTTTLVSYFTTEIPAPTVFGSLHPPVTFDLFRPSAGRLRRSCLVGCPWNRSRVTPTETRSQEVDIT